MTESRRDKVNSIIKHDNGYFIEVNGKKIEEDWNKDANTQFDAMQSFEENIIIQKKLDPEKSYTIGIVQRRMFYNEKKNKWEHL